MNTKNKSDNNTIKTYCYGELHTFPTIHAAKMFYTEAMQNSEGMERERYADIHCKLILGHEPYCDCDGIPTNKKAVKPLTQNDIARAQQIIEEQKAKDAYLDSLRAELFALQEKFNKDNADLIERIRITADSRNYLALQLIELEKRGFKA